MSGTNSISDLLAQILAAVYGRDVRQSIHDAIETCYTDVQGGVTAAETAAAAANSAATSSESRTTAAITAANSSVATAVSNCNTAITGANTAAANANTAVTRISTTLASVASVEPTTTASMEHAVNGFFYMNGLLYVATQAIAIGDTITEGVNCETAVLMDSLPSTQDDVLYIVGA